MAVKKQKKVGWYDGVAMPLGRLHREIEAKVLRPNLVKDEDGDWPVEVILVDRTATRGLQFQPLPYTHDRTADIGALRDAGLPALERAEEVAELNLRIAVDEFSLVRRELRTLREKER